MFTGIVETMGELMGIATNGSNKTFWIKSSLANDLKVDQSLAHDGVCLTIEDIKYDTYKVTAIRETLEKTTLNKWTIGTMINLERSLLPSSRLDGHFVQGHVDTKGVLEKKKDLDGSWKLNISFPKDFASLIIEKGSICLNGISLTVFNVNIQTFTIAVIPYTYNHTNIQFLKEQNEVNLEFDMIGKYLNRRMILQQP